MHRMGTNHRHQVIIISTFGCLMLIWQSYVCASLLCEGIQFRQFLSRINNGAATLLFVLVLLYPVSIIMRPNTHQSTLTCSVMFSRDIIFQANPFKSLPKPIDSNTNLFFIEEISPYTRYEHYQLTVSNNNSHNVCSPMVDPSRSFILWNPRNRGHVSPCYGEVMVLYDICCNIFMNKSMSVWTITHHRGTVTSANLITLLFRP